MQTGDKNTGERSGGVWGKGYHLSTIGDHGVDCPICTCHNDPEYLFGKLKDEVQKTIKCKGCKRKLLCILNPMDGAFTLTEILMKTNEYHVDMKIYEPTSRQEFPYALPFVKKLFGGDSDGTILKPGTFSFRVFMTPKEWEEFLDFGYSKGWMKIIGSELIAKGVAAPEAVLKEIHDLRLRDGIDINVDPS